MNSKKITRLIHDNSQLFWYIREEEKENIKEDQLVETILNYGNIKAIKRLFEVLGTERVAHIFYTHISSERSRNNYLELVANFFDLYFKRHVRDYPHQ